MRQNFVPLDAIIIQTATVRVFERICYGQSIRPFGGGGGMCILVEICEKRPFQKCMGWGGGMVTFLSKQSCKLDDAQDGAMLEGPLIILNPNHPHCCPLPQGQRPHWGTHPPACELEHIFFGFSQSCSLPALTGTHPVLRGMAHKPSVVRSTLGCLVSQVHTGCCEPAVRGFFARPVPSHLHPLCTPRVSPFMHQRLLWCIR